MYRKKNNEVKTVAHPFLWKHLSLEDVKKLESMTPEFVEKHFSEMMNLNEYKTDLVHGSLVDFYLTHYWWAARTQSFNAEQISIYFSIVFTLLESLKEKKIKIKQNIIEFQNVLSQVNQNVKLFSNEQINVIAEAVFVSFFQHYKMYEFLAYEAQTEYVISKEITIECPIPSEIPYPPPLDEALPEQFYNKYILKINDEPVPSTEKESIKSEITEALPEINKEIETQIKTMFDGLSVEDAKKIIYEVTTEMVADLKVEMRKSLKEKENALIAEISKVPMKSKN